MTDTADEQREQLLQAAERLHDLVVLLDWLEPRVRGALDNDWHIVSAAKWVARERARDVEKQLRQLDQFIDRSTCLDG